jgi:hypothetical protein
MSTDHDDESDSRVMPQEQESAAADFMRMAAPFLFEKAVLGACRRETRAGRGRARGAGRAIPKSRERAGKRSIGGKSRMAGGDAAGIGGLQDARRSSRMVGALGGTYRGARGGGRCAACGRNGRRRAGRASALVIGIWRGAFINEGDVPIRTVPRTGRSALALPEKAGPTLWQSQ